MRDEALLQELLDAESEAAVVEALQKRDLLSAKLDNRWRYLGNMPNNQSIVHNQQSTPAAALVEKYTNAVDAILMRHCRQSGIDPRGVEAPQSMAKAVELFFGDLGDLKRRGEELRKLAEENIVLYATGSRDRPSISLYDSGEGQLATDFPTTFCSLIYGSEEGAYKGAIPFVQGRFNMGGTGVLPFCSEQLKLQLIVSRVPKGVLRRDDHEWAYTLFCFFPSKQAPSWRYLVGPDGCVLTAGTDPIGLAPSIGLKSNELPRPRARKVSSGTLVKMYDYKAPKSNVCGELFKKLQEYLLRPSLPLRIVECRQKYVANVMGVNVWDRLGAWSNDKLEPGFEDGASISITLENGEVVPAEVRVFKLTKETKDDEDQPQTGLRALINGQSHAKRDAQFFRTRAVDKEHIAGSMLVTLDCTGLGQDSRNALFMSNRETFRDDILLRELFEKLQEELHDHEGLDALNKKRYQDKIANAVDDENGITALEELLATDPTLADLFSSEITGKIAAATAPNGFGTTVPGIQPPFKGLEYPTFFHRAAKSTVVSIEIPRGDVARASFITDVKNNYFSRRKYQGKLHFDGNFKPTPTFRLFNGRLTFTCGADKSVAEGSELETQITITDNHGSGPFHLTIKAIVVPPREQAEKREKEKKPPRAPAGPSRPAITEIDGQPEDPPLTVEREPNTRRLKLLLNRKSDLLAAAKQMRPKEEELVVAFVFKYGLALTAMGLLDSMKKTPEWEEDEAKCRQQIQKTCIGIARVIVPLCLSLPKKLPKAK